MSMRGSKQRHQKPLQKWMQTVQLTLAEHTHAKDLPNSLPFALKNFFKSRLIHHFCACFGFLCSVDLQVFKQPGMLASQTNRAYNVNDHPLSGAQHRMIPPLFGGRDPRWLGRRLILRDCLMQISTLSEC